MSKSVNGVKMSHVEKSRLRSERWIRIHHTKWKNLQKGEHFAKVMIWLWSIVVWAVMIIVPVAIVAFVIWLVIGSAIAVISAICVMTAIFTGFGDGLSRSAAPRRDYFW